MRPHLRRRFLFVNLDVITAMFFFVSTSHLIHENTFHFNPRNLVKTSAKVLRICHELKVHFQNSPI